MPKMVTRIISPETGGSSLGILRWNIISLHPGGQKSTLFLYLSPTVPRKNMLSLESPEENRGANL